MEIFTTAALTSSIVLAEKNLNKPVEPGFFEQGAAKLSEIVRNKFSDASSSPVRLGTPTRRQLRSAASTIENLSTSYAKITRAMGTMALTSLTFDLIERALCYSCCSPIPITTRLVCYLIPTAHAYYEITYDDEFPKTYTHRALNLLNRAIPNLCYAASLTSAAAMIYFGSPITGGISLSLLAIRTIDKTPWFNTGNKVHIFFQCFGVPYCYWGGNWITRTVATREIYEVAHDWIAAHPLYQTAQEYFSSTEVTDIRGE